ncbi:MAG: hypothetical protein WD136_01750 [Cyanobium sp.]
MKRVQLQLPDSLVAWIDGQADDIESRASFVRRSLVGLMKAEQRSQRRHHEAPQYRSEPFSGRADTADF